MKQFLIFTLLLITIPLEIIATIITLGVYSAAIDEYFSQQLIDKL